MGTIVETWAKSTGCLTEEGEIDVIVCGGGALGISLGAMMGYSVIETLNATMDYPEEEIEYYGHELDDS